MWLIVTLTDADTQPPFSLPLVQLAAATSTASSGPSHVIGYADQWPGNHAQGISAGENDRK